MRRTTHAKNACAITSRIAWGIDYIFVKEVVGMTIGMNPFSFDPFWQIWIAKAFIS